MQQGRESERESSIGKFFCVDNSVLEKENIKFTDVNVFEDAHMVLSVLERGYDILLLGDYIVTNSTGKIPGGTRNDPEFKERFEQNIRDFAELHPFVVLKETKKGLFYNRPSSVGMTIYWKKTRQSFVPKNEDW